MPHQVLFCKPKPHKKYEAKLVLNRKPACYPNQFFRLDEAELAQFVLDVCQITKPEDYEKLVKKYGLERMNPAFWSHDDAFNFQLRETEPIEGGLLDLSRYKL